MADLKDEEQRLQSLIADKVVAQVRRHRANELMLEFSDGSRLFVNVAGQDLDLSVTGS
ncbi:MAG: hypothetical protein H6519_04540 [Microthrixaceae bacterium]|nr:hypothetical protein [Acidimicrobiales bacterium]MCB9403687.1 hypothetical protein [Microthrixaceae bacterium]